MEYLTKVVMAQESERQGRVVDRILVIADMDGLSTQHWNESVKEFMKCIAKESRFLFPETMHSTVVANVPWLLAKAVWPIVRMFLHPVTQSKFVFASAGDVQSRLLELVDSSNLPPFLGGSCCCQECLSGNLRGGSMQKWEEENQVLAAGPGRPKEPSQIQMARSIKSSAPLPNSGSQIQLLFLESLCGCFPRQSLGLTDREKRAARRVSWIGGETPVEEAIEANSVDFLPHRVPRKLSPRSKVSQQTQSVPSTSVPVGLVRFTTMAATIAVVIVLATRAVARIATISLQLV
eukprot:TRINITY_DN53138_c0_g1_i1.p1 TRINITY_DN53138_c0_g1~~TRINITY_DN53138_c0_g1_i1.p1  ORF type:complete len:323 (-),score=50.60 TRINITY_DN53138_c0_g1_i1:74-949(-)